ncbi:MAG: cytidylate kinase family protein [Chloroflexi bacterium]|nr:cytidylate kinase family protein [Chloroflexota bacterium]
MGVVITISRQIGSLGDAVAEELAKRLSVPLTDRSKMVAEAYRYGLTTNRQTPPEIAERKPTLLQRLDEERHRFSVLLRAMLYDFAATQETTVIIGLTAQMLFKNVRHALRTLTVAPFLVRVERVMREQGLDRQAAITIVRQSDSDRAGYHQYLHHVEWLRPELYDLVINTEYMRANTVVEMLLRTAELPDFQPTHESRQVLDDLALGARVEAMLVTSPRVAIDALEVRAERGQVTVSGLVYTEEERETAEQIVREAPGVRAFVSDIRLKPLPAPFP